MAELLLSILRWLDMQIHFLRMKLLMRHECVIHGYAAIVDRRPRGGVFCFYCNGP